MGGRRERRQPRDALTLQWTGTEREQLGDDEWSVVLYTARGRDDDDADEEREAVLARYHPALNHGAGASAADEDAPRADARLGAVWVGGAGGGLDGPARGLYPAACRQLQRLGVAGLRLHYRYPNYLDECVLDTLLGVEFLNREAGVDRIALVGHSFGGAVVITAGVLSGRVAAVVPMSTQTFGADPAPRVSPRPMLLVHGTNDQVLPDACSRRVYFMAREPKELKLYPGAGHGLDEVREDLLDLLVTWIPERLRQTARR